MGGWGVKKNPKFNQSWCVSYLHEWHMQRHEFLGLQPPPPPRPWGGVKRSNIIKSQLLNPIPKIFKPNFACLLTNERYKTYQTGFSFDGLGHAPGVGLVGTEGGWVVKKKNFLKFNQSWCVRYLHEWHMQQHNFLGPPPPGALGRGQRSNIIKSHLLNLSISNIFKPNIVCLLTNERCKTY